MEPKNKWVNPILSASEMFQIANFINRLMKAVMKAKFYLWSHAIIILVCVRLCEVGRSRTFVCVYVSAMYSVSVKEVAFLFVKVRNQN